MLTHHRPVQWGWRGSLRCRTACLWQLCGWAPLPLSRRGGPWLRNKRSQAGSPGPSCRHFRSPQSPVQKIKNEKKLTVIQTNILTSHSWGEPLRFNGVAMLVCFNDNHMFSPLTRKDPFWAAPQPTPVELPQRPEQSWFRRQPPAPACVRPSLASLLLGAAPANNSNNHFINYPALNCTLSIRHHMQS